MRATITELAYRPRGGDHSSLSAGNTMVGCNNPHAKGIFVSLLRSNLGVRSSPNRSDTSHIVLSQS